VAQNKNLLDAVASLEGKWISPDPLAFAIRSDSTGPGRPGAVLAAEPARRAVIGERRWPMRCASGCSPPPATASASHAGQLRTHRSPAASPSGCSATVQRLRSRRLALECAPGFDCPT